jgi:hypothetical protein
MVIPACWNAVKISCPVKFMAMIARIWAGGIAFLINVICAAACCLIAVIVGFGCAPGVPCGRDPPCGIALSICCNDCHNGKS